MWEIAQFSRHFALALSQYFYFILLFVQSGCIKNSSERIFVFRFAKRRAKNQYVGGGESSSHSTDDSSFKEASNYIPYRYIFPIIKRKACMEMLANYSLQLIRMTERKFTWLFQKSITKRLLLHQVGALSITGVLELQRMLLKYKGKKNHSGAQKKRKKLRWKWLSTGQFAPKWSV